MDVCPAGVAECVGVLVEAASLMASRDGCDGDLVEAAAWGWSASPARQTAREVMSAATARTASSEGSTAATMLRPVRCDPRRRRGAESRHDGPRR